MARAPRLHRPGTSPHPPAAHQRKDLKISGKINLSSATVIALALRPPDDHPGHGVLRLGAGQQQHEHPVDGGEVVELLGGAPGGGQPVLLLHQVDVADRQVVLNSGGAGSGQGLGDTRGARGEL